MNDEIYYQEMIKEYKKCLSVSVERSNELELQNDALLKALNFYANESNYMGWTDLDYQWTGQAKDYPSSIEEDMGEIARQAISKDEGDI